MVLGMRQFEPTGLTDRLMSQVFINIVADY